MRIIRNNEDIISVFIRKLFQSSCLFVFTTILSINLLWKWRFKWVHKPSPHHRRHQTRNLKDITIIVKMKYSTIFYCCLVAILFQHKTMNFLRALKNKPLLYRGVVWILNYYKSSWKSRGIPYFVVIENFHRMCV